MGVHVLGDDARDAHVMEGLGESHAIDHAVGRADVIDEERSCVGEHGNRRVHRTRVNGGVDHCRFPQFMVLIIMIVSRTITMSIWLREPSDSIPHTKSASTCQRRADP